MTISAGQASDYYMTLPREYYTSQEWFDRDVARVCGGGSFELLSRAVVVEIVGVLKCTSSRRCGLRAHRRNRGAHANEHPRTPHLEHLPSPLCGCKRGICPRCWTA